MRDRTINFPLAWQPADILAFSGSGSVSLGIKIGSCSSISHVSGIGYVPSWQLASLSSAGVLSMSGERLRSWRDRHLLFESSTLVDRACAITGLPIKGVQAQNPEDRIRNYDGRVWLYRLTPAWQRDFTADKSRRLTGHLLAGIGRQYDGSGAILSGTKVVKHLWAWRRVDRSSLFCSEYLAGVLQHVGLFPISNASKITPGSLVQRLVAADVYRPAQPIKI